MLRDLAILLTYASFFVLGAVSPFVLILGYVWVDTFLPQAVAYSLLRGMPVSQMAAIAGIGAYFLLDRRSPPRPSTIMALTLLMGSWVTLTATWAVVPDAAWWKWDWAFKTVVFSAFIPFFFRTRVQIEAFIQVFLFSAVIHILTVGLKSLIGGARYNNNLGILFDSNSGLAESSTLATVSIMLIPIMLWLRRHSLLVPAKLRTPLYTGMIVLNCAAAIGTFARTGLIGFLVVGAGMWVRSRYKIASTLLLGVAGTCIALLVPDAWVARVSTIASPEQESSAGTRLAVWRWTLEFVQSHPFGGGFEAYRVNVIQNTNADGEVIVQYGRAFHSIYFEMLGEHGWVGLGLFLTLAVISIMTLRSTIRRTRRVPELEWCHDLAGALQTAAFVLFACGSFIGIGFQPIVWYVFALTAATAQYARRVFGAAPTGSPHWKTRFAPAAPNGTSPPATAASGFGSKGGQTGTESRANASPM